MRQIVQWLLGLVQRILASVTPAGQNSTEKYWEDLTQVLDMDKMIKELAAHWAKYGIPVPADYVKYGDCFHEIKWN